MKDDDPFNYPLFSGGDVVRLIALTIVLVLIGLLVAWLALRPAMAHDRWADGSPVPAWVKGYCCGPADVHHYRYDEVKITPDGFVLPDYRKVIPIAKALPSEDGDYWAFFVTYSTGEQSEIYCFFAPPGSM